MVAELMKSKPRDTWIRELEAVGIPAAAIRTVAEVCEGDVLRERDMIAVMPHATAGPVKGIKSPLHMSESALDRYIAPPTLGEHSDEILRERCGFGDEEIAALRRESVI